MRDGKWWDESWSPVTGCTPISEGCGNCWAERMSKRLAGRLLDGTKFWDQYPKGYRMSDRAFYAKDR